MTTSLPPNRPRLILRAGALAAGYNDDEIKRLRRSGQWTSAARGAYFDNANAPKLSGAERHRLMVDTAVPRLSGEPVVSHLSAVVLHGLPLWRTHLNEVHVTRRAPRLNLTTSFSWTIDASHHRPGPSSTWPEPCRSNRA